MWPTPSADAQPQINGEWRRYVQACLFPFIDTSLDHICTRRQSLFISKRGQSSLQKLMTKSETLANKSVHDFGTGIQMKIPNIP